ncbi:MAG TPA: DUF433 domain-containing protein [Burkholderiaceae bacterium]|nr:DUF433 domain-containing protein [Burkholderiaceae bacterium]
MSNKTISRTDVHDEPAYRAAEAAHILGLPAGTVQAWCFGHDYLHKDGSRKRFARVVAPPDPKQRLLSFANLCELHVLAVIRRHHRVRLAQVREAVAFMRDRLGADRPLASGRFRTNGIDLFVEHAGLLLNVSKQGQLTLREDFERTLERIEFGADDDRPIRLFPFTRPPRASDRQPRTVLVDPTLSFGRPVLMGAFVRTEVVEARFQAGDSIADMARDYGVEGSVIEEALRFEQRRAA